MTRDGHNAVAREYRELAGRYDARWGFYVEASVRETLRRLPQDPGRRILDVACGTGRFLEAVTAIHPTVALTGVDISPEMLAVARQRLPSDAALCVGTADALPFVDSSFDTVASTSAFHFFRDPRGALREMRRVLRPGGVLAITDWCDDYLTCRICDRLLRLLTTAHFRVYGSAECRRLLEHEAFDGVAVEPYKISWLWGLMTAVARKPV